MRDTLVRFVLAAAMTTGAPLAAPAAEDATRAPPDLSVVPRERNRLLLQLERDPELHARAASGGGMIAGGWALAVAGVVAVPVGFFVFTHDVLAGVDAPRGQKNRLVRGPAIVGAGGLAILGGTVLIVTGRQRQEDAERAFHERRNAARTAR